MARINTDNAEKSRGIFAARMRGVFANFLASKLADVFSKNPANPASRACPVFFLDANSWQFLHLAQGAKSRDAREVRGRCVFTIPCKLACEGI